MRVKSEAVKKSILLLTLIFVTGLSAQERMALITGGSYLPLYNKVTKRQKVASFFLDIQPVTNADFLYFTRKNSGWTRSHIKPLFTDGNYLRHWKSDTSLAPGTEQVPVTNVSWFAARAYCRSQGKRLPTVHEWEFTATFGKTGQNPKEVEKLVLEWYSQPSSGPLKPVRSTWKNSRGVWDMHGLVWEWTEDFSTAMVTGESRGNTDLDRNLYCGEGSKGVADPGRYSAFMRYAFRSSLNAKYTVANLGFRCAKDLK